MNRLQKILKARANGIKIPYRAMLASEKTGLPFPALCAVLEKESAGGMNVFGHDPTIYAGAGTVTKEKYLAYKARRGPQGRGGMQGVGPMQLTWYSYQDQADAIGGCWKPLPNMIVGARLLKSYWDASHNWVTVGTRYNGAVSYGQDLAAKVRKWENLLS